MSTFGAAIVSTKNWPICIISSKAIGFKFDPPEQITTTNGVEESRFFAYWQIGNMNVLPSFYIFDLGLRFFCKKRRKAKIRGLLNQCAVLYDSDAMVAEIHPRVFVACDKS